MIRIFTNNKTVLIHCTEKKMSFETDRGQFGPEEREWHPTDLGVA